MSFSRPDKPVTVIAPTIYPLGKQGYAGVERLVSLFLRGLLANGVGNVACVCTTPSILPRGVQRIDSGQPINDDYREPWLLPTVSVLRETASIFLDFSHSKYIGRLCPDVAHLSPIWHDPKIMVPPQPKKNVVCLSQWQLERFREVYQQDGKVLDPHMADGDYLVAGDSPRGDYLVYLGKLHPTKGAGLAIAACKKYNQRLIIIGTVTPGDPPEYVAQVKAACDGDQIVFHGPAIGDEKLHLYQGAKALFYPVNYEEGTGEAHSHKSVEPPLCGTPVVLYDQGAMRELFDDGVTGLVIAGEGELPEALQWAETLDRAACRQRALERWDYRAVIKRWLPVMAEVVGGSRW